MNLQTRTVAIFLKTFCFLTILFWKASVCAQETLIAYVSTQPASIARDRAKAIVEEFERRWPKESKAPRLKIDIFALSFRSQV